MRELEQQLVQAIEEDHDYVVALREYFHSHPELPSLEFNTQIKIEEELDKLGLPHQRVANTGVVTEIIGEKEGDRTIVLRADIDALPMQELNDVPYKSTVDGVMHACGHDAHNASLIGAVRVLAKHRDLFGGKVIVTFQPGEEIGYGARLIVNSGVIDEADRSFGIHVSSGLEKGKIVVSPGPCNAAVDQFKIIVHGKGGHIAHPQSAVDATFIAAKITVDSQTIVPRRIDPLQNVLLGIGHVEAGTTYNIIPDDAIIEGTLRSFDQKVREQVLSELEGLARRTAEQYGGTIEFFNKDNTSPLINDPVASAEVQKTAIALFGEENVITQKEPSMGGDDMAEYILKVPGVYAFVGSRNNDVPSTGAPHHNGHFDLDPDSLSIATKIYAIYAVEYLNHLV